MKLVLYLLFWRNVDGYVNIYNIDMFDFIIVRDIWNKCYICKGEFTDSMKCFDYLYKHNELKWFEKVYVKVSQVVSCVNK